VTVFRGCSDATSALEIGGGPPCRPEPALPSFRVFDYSQCIIDPELHPAAGVALDLLDGELVLEHPGVLVDRINGDEPRGYLGTGIRGPLDRLDQQAPAESLNLVVIRNGETVEQHLAERERG